MEQLPCAGTFNPHQCQDFTLSGGDVDIGEDVSPVGPTSRLQQGITLGVCLRASNLGPGTGGAAYYELLRDRLLRQLVTSKRDRALAIANNRHLLAVGNEVGQTVRYLS